MRWTGKHSIHGKLLWVVLATTSAALLVAAAALGIYDVHEYERTWVNDLTTQADIMGRASSSALAFDDPRTARENLALLQARPNITAAAIYNARGGLFASYGQGDAANLRLPEMPEAEGARVVGKEIVLFRRIVEKNEHLGTVYLRGRYEVLARLQDYGTILLIAMIPSLLVALLVSSWLNSAVTKPISDISEVARKVMESRDFSLRATKRTQDEIGYLVDAFNDMLAEVGRRATALEETNRTLEHEMGERRGAEQRLLAADRRKDEFLATLAHELRNPLAPMRNALEILRTAGHNPDVARSSREMMERQVRQLVRVVDDLLDVSRITTGKLTLKKEPVELRAIVNNAVETARPFIELRKHRFTLNLPPQRVYLDADATRLEQVFLNLLNNAAKFTDSGGRITLGAELQDEQVVVTVTDTGIGINAEMLPQIFEMFSQVDHSLERAFAGLGVGLTLARHLIELHGGALEAQSAGLKLGSRFIVRLPISSAVADTAQPSQAVGGRTNAIYRILLADDNEDYVESLAMLLRGMGHEVHVTHDGLEALQAAPKVKPDFAFLDIGLPKLNGYDLSRRLHEMPAMAHTVFVAVTGWGQEDDKQRAKEAGYDHHMVKPVEPDQVRHILEHAHA